MLRQCLENDYHNSLVASSNLFKTLLLNPAIIQFYLSLLLSFCFDEFLNHLVIFLILNESIRKDLLIHHHFFLNFLLIMHISVIILMSNSSHQSKRFSTESAPFQCPSFGIVRCLLAHLRFPSKIKATWFGISPFCISLSSRFPYILYSPDKFKTISLILLIFYHQYCLKVHNDISVFSYF